MVPGYQLLDAAKAGDLQVAREAIDRGADVEFRDSNRVNSLFLAYAARPGSLLLRSNDGGDEVAGADLSG